jgi:hypothetical protein
MNTNRVSDRHLTVTYVYHSILRSARHRAYEFTLSREIVERMIFDSCFYCGKYGGNSPTRVGKRWILEWNGIDRVDNEEGYTYGNVVTCFGTCNKMKGQLTKDYFLSLVSRIVENQDIKKLMENTDTGMDLFLQTSRSE